MHDDAAAGRDIHRANLAGEAGGEGDQPLVLLRRVAVLEDGFAGEHAPESAAETALRAGLHLHVWAHPAHRAAFGHHGFAGLQRADHHGQVSAFDFVVHKQSSFKKCRL